MRDDSHNRSVNWFELDRLVDGQLNNEEYRELIRQIDKDPDGWRQCALAFLQHQALQQELQALSTDPAHPWAAAVAGQTADQAAVPPLIRRTIIRSLQLAGCVAATLLIGVSLGVALRPQIADPLLPLNPVGSRDWGTASHLAVGPDAAVDRAAATPDVTYVRFSLPRTSSQFCGRRDQQSTGDPYAGDPFIGNR